jgi:ferric-dicitrate binding protein FerR (iron transport regulator)
MENQADINILIIRLLSGEATAHEKGNIEEWLSHSADNRKLYSDLQEIWLSTGALQNADNYDVESAIWKFRNRISTEKEKLKYQSRIITLLKYAAVAILIIALPFSYYFGVRNTGQQSATTVSCAFGDKSSIILPDSSRVWLNSGSKLTFNSDFKNGGREVILEGEAYFSVSKHKDNPFLVKTSDIEIEVLGTKFNVKAYPEENSISTTLVEGSIQISSKSQNALMKPNQKLVFDKESQKMVMVKLADTAPETEWKEGRLVFRNQTLEELRPKLERWFDVDIVFSDDQVKQLRFTGILERESILEVVYYFDLSNRVSCHIQGNKVIIKSEN